MLSAALYIFYCSLLSKYDPLLAYGLMITALFFTALQAHGVFYTLFGADDSPMAVEYVE